MFTLVLTLHSIVRWLVVIAVSARFAVAAAGIGAGRPWGKLDRAIGGATLGVVHTNIAIGLLLFPLSPTVQTATADMAAAMHQPVLRFFTVEHGPMMLVAAIAATVGQAAASRAQGDAKKHRIAAIGFGIALVLLLIGVPWPFRAEIARPWLTLAM